MTDLFSTAYDGAHRLVAIEDGLGHRIDYTLDALGHRIEERVFDPHATLVRSHRRLYDALGRLVEEVGGAGQVSRYGYDAQGNRIAATDPRKR